MSAFAFAVIFATSAEAFSVVATSALASLVTLIEVSSFAKAIAASAAFWAAAAAAFSAAVALVFSAAILAAAAFLTALSALESAVALAASMSFLDYSASWAL